MTTRIVLLFLSGIFLRLSSSAVVVNRQDDCKNIQNKCTAKDPRLIYTRCMLYSVDHSLWCDQSNYTKIPNPDNIKSFLPCKNALALYINDSCLSDISKEDLKPYKKIETFMCGRNYVRELKGQIFHSNTKLKTIDFCTNQIKEIDSNTFSKLSELKILNLANNRIKDLKPRTFSDLTSLSEMSLHNNKIFLLRNHVFHGLKSLKILKLTKNKIARLSSSSFNHLELLTHLHLDENKLEEISLGTFDNLENLEVLTISNNEIKTFGQNDLPSLHTLNIASNLLEEFDSSSVSKLPSMQNLHLCKNFLTTVEEDLFHNNRYLRYLGFAGNNLKSIPRNTFHGLCHLETLVLRNNRLHTPEPQWFNSIIENDRPDGNDLSENRWDCSCNAFEHWTFLQRLNSEKPHWSDALEIGCGFKDFKHCSKPGISPDQTCQNKSTSFIPKRDIYEYAVEHNEVVINPTNNIEITEFPQSKTLPDNPMSEPAIKVHTIMIYLSAVIIAVCIMVFLMINYWKRKTPVGNQQKQSSSSRSTYVEDSKQDQYDHLNFDEPKSALP